ncbi:DUF551 domain-containing protein [Acinetobacter beijerinckii]|uniref:DUF551 domain-containing protein n=1 Tax=Acinetobacter beijerinckii TaxID=262668 RepID=UPI003AF91693
MTKDIEREALEDEIELFISEAMKSYVVDRWADSYKHTSPFDYVINDENEVWWMKAQAHQLWQFWQAAKAHEAKKLEGCVVVPEWISTSDYLPDEGIEVLVHRYGQVVQATRDSNYAGGFKERNCYGWQATYNATYWMPKNFKLPEGYSFYYNDEHPYKETILEAARGGNEN